MKYLGLWSPGLRFFFLFEKFVKPCSSPYYILNVCSLIRQLILTNRQHRFGLRNNPDFAVPKVKSIHKGLESLSYLGPKNWELLPLAIKEIETLLHFNASPKKWNPQNCPSVFAKDTCRMLNPLRLIISVNS